MTIDKTPAQIHIMFNTIASQYDKMNNIMSFGLHKFIKYLCIKQLPIKPHDNVIDLCCGTGDLSGIVKKLYPKACIIGIDFSEKMLEIAQSKYNNIQYIQADVTHLPYPDNCFDIAIMGFGLRNIQNAEKAVEEVYRILKNGGIFLHLDFGEKNFLSKIFDEIIPFISKIFTKNSSAYTYLIKSKKIFPTPNELIKDFESKGFKFSKKLNFLGVISAQIMTK